MRIATVLLALTVGRFAERKDVLVLENGQHDGGLPLTLIYSDIVAAIGEHGLSEADIVANTPDGRHPLFTVPLKVEKWASDFAWYVIKASKLPWDPMEKPVMFTNQGFRVIAWETITPGDHLLLVPRSFRFFWPAPALGHVRTLSNALIDQPHADRPVEIEVLHTQPRVFHVRNFVSDEECDQLIESALSITHANNKLQRSTTGLGDRKTAEKNDRRTSDNAFDEHSPVAVRLMKRIFQLTRVPYDMTQADGIQTVRYKKLQAYNSHHDYFPPTTDEEAHNYNPAEGGTNRFATLFVYLTTVPDGGQTVFPNANVSTGKRVFSGTPDAEGSLVPAQHKDAYADWLNSLVKYCYDGFSVPARKGDAVLFYSQLPSRQLDEFSLHGGCPVLGDDVKWGANLWVWNGKRPGYADTQPITITFENVMPTTTLQVWHKGALVGTLSPGDVATFTTTDSQKYIFKAPTFQDRFWAVRVDAGLVQTVPVALQPANATTAPSDLKLTVLFVNRLSAPINIMWVPPTAGQANTFIATMAPNESKDIFSYEGHTFSVESVGRQPHVVQVYSGFRDDGVSGVEPVALKKLQPQQALVVADATNLPVSGHTEL